MKRKRCVYVNTPPDNKRLKLTGVEDMDEISCDHNKMLSEITHDMSGLMKHMTKLNSDLSIEDVMKIYNNKSAYLEFSTCFKMLNPGYENANKSQSLSTEKDENTIENEEDKSNVCKLTVTTATTHTPTPTPLNLITTIDLEKEKTKNLLDEIYMSGPWFVGLLLNMEKLYNRKGELRKKEKNVKSLTIFFITNMQLNDLQNTFDNKNKVPYKSLKPYCGMIFVVYAMTNFDCYENAKRAFRYVKKHTRGPFSRLQSCLVTADIMKRSICPNLEHYMTSLSPKENIVRAKNKGLL